MFTKVVTLSILVLQFLLFAGCSTLKTGLRSQRTDTRATEVVSVDRARQLALAISTWDRQKLDDLVRSDEGSDPILLCAEGNFEMREGNFSNALSLFQDAMALVDQRRIPIVSQAISFQPHDETKKRNAESPSVAEDKEIVQSARQFFYNEISNAEMIRVLASRSGSIPYPPTYQSTMGLTLEIVGQHSGKVDYLSYRFANYPATSEDSVKASLAVRKVLAINAVTSALLTGDREALRSGIETLKGLPKADSEAAFFIGIAGFFLRTDDAPKFLNRNVRSLLTN